MPHTPSASATPVASLDTPLACLTPRGPHRVLARGPLMPMPMATDMPLWVCTDVESLDTTVAVSPTATGPLRVLARGLLMLMPTAMDTPQCFWDVALLPTLDAPS